MFERTSNRELHPVMQSHGEHADVASREYYRRRAIRDSRIRNPHPSKTLFHARMKDRLRFYGRCGA